MRFMFDINTCIAVMNRKSERLSLKMRSNLSAVCISSLTLAELRFGAENSRDRAQNQQAVDVFLRPVSIEPFDEAAAYVYGIVRARLRREGRPIGPVDTLIGAHALALNATLVTGNLREFQRIEGLKVEDWSR